MHLSMSFPRGRRAGIPRFFDYRLGPKGRQFVKISCFVRGTIWPLRAFDWVLVNEKGGFHFLGMTQIISIIYYESDGINKITKQKR